MSSFYGGNDHYYQNVIQKLETRNKELEGKILELEYKLAIVIKALEARDEGFLV